MFVIDESPQIAAEMANAFVRQLDSVNIQLRVKKARDNRRFLEARLSQCKLDLAAAEQRLKEFQETHGVIEVTEQASIVEAKETPTVQVLDWAIPPIRKYVPKRAFIVLGAFFFSIFMSLVRHVTEGLGH